MTAPATPAEVAEAIDRVRHLAEGMSVRDRLRLVAALLDGYDYVGINLHPRSEERFAPCAAAADSVARGVTCPALPGVEYDVARLSFGSVDVTVYSPERPVPASATP